MAFRIPELINNLIIFILNKIQPINKQVLYHSLHGIILYQIIENKYYLRDVYIFWRCHPTLFMVEIFSTSRI